MVQLNRREGIYIDHIEMNGVIPMTQDELIRRLAEEADLFLYQARSVLRSLPEIIAETVAEGDTVRLKGFGIFRAQEFAPKIGRNPGTGEEIPIPARRSLVFKPTKRLRELDGDFKAREAANMAIKDTFDKENDNDYR